MRSIARYYAIDRRYKENKTESKNALRRSIALFGRSIALFGRSIALFMNSVTVATDTFWNLNRQIFQRYYLRSIALFIAIDRTIHMNSDTVAKTEKYL